MSETYTNLCAYFDTVLVSVFGIHSSKPYTINSTLCRQGVKLYSLHQEKINHKELFGRRLGKKELSAHFQCLVIIVHNK